ncbi:MAG: hypothetical protein ABIF88_03150 [archaeon]
MTHYKIAPLDSPDLRAKQVLGIIRDSGMEIIDPSFRACDPEVREAYLYGLKSGIFTHEDVKVVHAEYRSRELSRRALNTHWTESYESQGGYSRKFLDKNRDIY